jgi:hypothetical protein
LRQLLVQWEGRPTQKLAPHPAFPLFREVSAQWLQSIEHTIKPSTTAACAGAFANACST